jgi:glycosyltransferase involved in cell wall biosynthesis
MKIWIVNQDADSPEAHGPTRSYDLCAALAAKGHEVTLIKGNFSHVRRRQIHQPSFRRHQEFQEGFTIVHLPALSYTRNNWRRLTSALCFGLGLVYFRPQHNKPDLIIGSSPNPISAYAAFMLAKKLQVSFFYEIRDLWPATLLTLGRFSEKHPIIALFKEIERRLSSQSDRVIAVLPGISQYLFEHYHIPAEKILYLPNFVKIEPVATYSQRPTKNEQFTYLYLGSHNIANALDTLVEASKLLQEQHSDHIQIKLVGEGSEKERLRELCKAYDLQNITFHPAVCKTEINEVLSNADAHLILWQDTPLYQWGTSANKMFDYMMSGKPIIEAIEGKHSIVKKANCGLNVPPENARELANAMVYLSQILVAEQTSLGENGRQYAVTHHNLETLATKLEEASKKTTEERKVSRSW